MNTDELSTISRQVDEFSLVNLMSDREETPRNIETHDFQEILLSLASIFRRKELAYNIQYSRPDKPEFRLRSDKSLKEDITEKEFSFSEPGRTLTVVVENPGNTILNGLASELKLLGELEKNEEDTSREPELNLLVSRTFQAELYSEYQRWKRYDSPFLLIVVRCIDEVDWRPAGKALKHVSKTRDIIGFLDENHVAAFFPSMQDYDATVESITKHLLGSYKSDEFELSTYRIPDDVQDWNALKSQVFDPMALAKSIERQAN